MWIVFNDVDAGTKPKDVIHLLLSFEVPARIGESGARSFAAEVKDANECILPILNKHRHHVQRLLGEDTRFHSSNTLPGGFRVKDVRGRAEA